MSKPKWASWSAIGPIWMPQAPKTLCLIQFWSWENSLFSLLALWGNRNWPPSMKVKKLEILHQKNGLKGCKWSSLRGPGTETPLSYSISIKWILIHWPFICVHIPQRLFWRLREKNMILAFSELPFSVEIKYPYFPRAWLSKIILEEMESWIGSDPQRW